MKNSKTSLLILVMLMLPLAVLADGIKSDTASIKYKNKTALLTNERDSVVVVRDTTYPSSHIMNITIKNVTKKIYDTVYTDAAYLAAKSNAIKANQADEEDDEFIDFDDEIDIGGDDDAANINYDIPASDVYSIWINKSVNPYNTDVTKIQDTIKFDMQNFVYPLLKPLHITSKFGYRRGRNHNGIDLKLYIGDTVVAPMNGVVRVVGNNGRKGFGKFIVIRHYNGLETVYGHLSQPLVEENQLVSAGEVIALGGNTGRSTGSHLHWEMRYLGNPINPEEIIDFENQKTKADIYCLDAKKTFRYIVETAEARYWVVKKGDTLGRISRNTGKSIKQICKLNNITEKTILQIGRKLRYN
jgi:murein DD-endopeptidase MepM/ murein hydrolase activator NlpD